MEESEEVNKNEKYTNENKIIKLSETTEDINVKTVECETSNILIPNVAKFEQILNEENIHLLTNEDPELFDDPLNNNSSNILKESYENAIKEIEDMKEKMKEQHRDLKQLLIINIELENKLSNANQELEELKYTSDEWRMNILELKEEMSYLQGLIKARNEKLQIRRKQLKNEPEKKLQIVEPKSEIKMNKPLELEPSGEEQYIKEIDEVPILKSQKIYYERNMEDHAEKLKELTQEVESLKQTKLELEMMLKSIKQENKQLVEVKEEELEDVRCNAQKKIKSYERQLEKQQKQRMLWLREKQELEEQLQSAYEREMHDRAKLQSVRRDLRRMKVLLKDVQTELKKQMLDDSEKVIIQQLKTQLEDLDCARSIAVKAKYSLENEKLEIQSKLEETLMEKRYAEEHIHDLRDEKNFLQIRLEENEKEAAQILRKFEETVEEIFLKEKNLEGQVSFVSELETKKEYLNSQLAELTIKLGSLNNVADLNLDKKSEIKVNEVKTKLILEQAYGSMLHLQINRLKHALQKEKDDMTKDKLREKKSAQEICLLQLQLKEAKEELNRSHLVAIKKTLLEKRCEILETECATIRKELNIASKRIEHLQCALQGDLENGNLENSDCEEIEQPSVYEPN